MLRTRFIRLFGAAFVYFGGVFMPDVWIMIGGLLLMLAEVADAPR